MTVILFVMDTKTLMRHADIAIIWMYRPISNVTMEHSL